MNPLIQEDTVIISYENWRRHPITTELVKNLAKLKSDFVKLMINDSVSVNKVTDQEYRHHGVSLRQIETCIELCTNYNAFKTLLNK